MRCHQTNDTLLRNTLNVNGVLSAATGLACVFASGPLAGLLFQREFLVLSLTPSGLLVAIGIGLLAFAALLLLSTRQTVINRYRALFISALDTSWVAGSAFLLIVYPDYFSTFGFVITAGVAVIVLVFAIGQVVGLGMMCRGGNDSVNRRTNPLEQ